MLSKRFVIVSIAVFVLPIQLEAKQANDASTTRLVQGASGASISEKSPEVFVDLSGLEGTSTARKSSDHSSATNGLANPSVGDPLAAPLMESSESASGWIRTSAINRWTRHPLTAAAISIGLVLLGYGLFRGLSSRKSVRRPGRLPRQVIELVGFVPLSPRQQLQLVRLGSKLVLVAVSANGAEPIAEVTDPVEVDQILAACQAGQSSLASAIGRLTGRPTNREYANVGNRLGARALFEA